MTADLDPLARALASLRDVQPPPELSLRIGTETRRVRQRSATPAGWVFGVAAAVTALALLATSAFILRPSSGPATVPSASTTLTPGPSQDASIAPSGTDGADLGPVTIAVATREI